MRTLFALAAAAPVAGNIGVIVVMALSAAIYGVGVAVEDVSSAQLLLLGNHLPGLSVEQHTENLRPTQGEASHDRGRPRLRLVALIDRVGGHRRRLSADAKRSRAARRLVQTLA